VDMACWDVIQATYDTPQTGTMAQTNLALKHQNDPARSPPR